jgi:hypothetical protein
MIRAGYDVSGAENTLPMPHFGCGSFSTDKSGVASGPFPLGDESDVPPSPRL